MIIRNLATCIKKRDEKRYRPPVDYRQDWYDACEKLQRWHERHRMGAVTDEEERELQDLQLLKLGSYYVYRISIGKPAIDSDAVSMRDEIKDWIK
jgi:hypothetical protein